MSNLIIEEITNIIRIHGAQHSYTKDQLQNLLDLISHHDEYAIFSKHCHKLGAFAGRCINNETDFPNALLARSLEIGAQDTINEVQEYIDNDNIKLEIGILLYQVTIDTEYEFCNGVRLMNTTSIHDSKILRFIANERMSGGVFSSFLVTDYESPKQFHSSISSDSRKSDWTKVEIKTKKLQILQDTRLLLSMARHPEYGIPAVASFELVPDKLQFLNNGNCYSSFPEPRTSFGPEIIEIEIRKADRLIEKFNQLEDDTKNNLRIAMKRLNDCKIDPDWANKCINLRICLENLFCSEADEYISTSISERAPNYTSFSKTRALKIYKFLSSAVHTGIAPIHENITEREITHELHAVILRFIDQGGYPIWTTSAS